MDQPPKTVRVVAVDDDPDILMFVQSKLHGRSDIELVGTGRSGREALQLANRLRPDVMVLDIMMPVLNGLEAAARITAVFPSIGLVMLTGETAPEYVKEAMVSGAKDYLSKTTDMDRIVDAILRTAARRDPAAPSKGMASVWTFYGPKANSGTTTLALSTAFDLASLDYKVLLLDLDPLHGDLGFYLDLQPRGREKHLLSQLESLSDFDATTLDSFTRPYPADARPFPHVDVIDCPGSFVDLGEKAESNLGAVMDFFLTKYNYIIADVPAGRIFDRSQIILLDFAEQLLVTSNRDMSSLKGLTTFTRVLGETVFSLKKVTVLFSENLTAPDVDHASYAAKFKTMVKDVLDVPTDRSAVSRAVRLGVPLVCDSPDSPVASFVKSMVERSLNLPPRQEKRSLWETFKSLVVHGRSGR